MVISFWASPINFIKIKKLDKNSPILYIWYWKSFSLSLHTGRQKDIMPRGNCKGQGWWHGKFRGCGYRLTAGREAILDILSKSEGHLSAEDIYVKIHPKYPSVGLTTVYRTLEVLSNLGMVYKLDFGDGRARYEFAEGPKGAHHHHHLVCTQCNKVIDYTDFIDEEVELLNQTEKGLGQKYKFRITNHLIQFYGVCEQCSGKK